MPFGVQFRFPARVGKTLGLLSIALLLPLPDLAAADPQQATALRSGSAIFQQQCASCHGPEGKGLSLVGTPDFTNRSARSGISRPQIAVIVSAGQAGTAMRGFTGRLTPAEIQDVSAYVHSLAGNGPPPGVYQPADDFVYTLPTGRRVKEKNLYLNFTHRFAYNPTFSGKGLGNTLLGLDGFSISSFGLRYGVTDKLSVSVYRSPSIIARPIEFTAAYNVLDEFAGHPFNATLRMSLGGQDNFRRNFTTSFEAVLSRSFSERAQFYAVPTVSIANRPVLSKPGALENRPAGLAGVHSFSLGTGLAVNVRPTVAVVTEVIPTLVNARDLGIFRPAYAFGIQKQVRGHAFTLGFSNSPGSTVAQRAGTRAAFLGNSQADKPSGLTIGFNLMRRLH